MTELPAGTLAPTYLTASEPGDLPPRLPEPGVDEIRLERVFAVLSEPLRLTIVQRLLREAEEFDHTCGWFGFSRPKSTLTHHFKSLREAGVISQRQYGLERRSRVRLKDLDTRFPGLIDMILTWTPAE
ncbi:ArsR/SmtB family transcription factor [Streptomyces sp. NBC_00525]|uniref:ArsR/SmtB family transcription factor n=1 Tax=Streptomyces sp. NBC_00525 TaxID=2903660 RepID=UPI002E808CAB|nr:ArsR family transcriptional regulator [Streptomyces sp. NBC_00525]WUC97178.1 helix-turn-helix domain-containing protein [Streptomyces sp. NBC_00525]